MIRRDNKIYNAWVYFDALNCLISSYYYAMISCLDHMDTTSWVIYFETVFAISLVLNFFVEYYHDGSTIPTREMKKIAIRYLKGGFFLDFLPLIPFASFIDLKENREIHFHMIKIIRLVKCE